MGLLTSLFQKKEKGKGPAAPEHAAKGPKVGTVLKVYVGGMPLLIGRINVITKESVVIGRQYGQLGLDLCKIGEQAHARAVDDITAYIIQGVVTSSTADELKLEELQILDFEERRECFRLDIEAPVTIYSGTDEGYLSPLENTHTVNLSADGVCIQAVSAFQMGDVLRLKLEFPNQPPINIPGRIVRVREPSPGVYQYGIFFHHAGRSDSEALTRVLFSIQRAQRK